MHLTGNLGGSEDTNTTASSPQSSGLLLVGWVSAESSHKFLSQYKHVHICAVLAYFATEKCLGGCPLSVPTARHFFPQVWIQWPRFFCIFDHSLELLALEELGKVFIFLWDLGIILVEMRCVFVQAAVWKMCLHAPCCELSFLSLSFIFWLHLWYVFISRAF